MNRNVDKAKILEDILESIYSIGSPVNVSRAVL